jgi:DNA polymerase-3 subunit delta'
MLFSHIKGHGEIVSSFRKNLSTKDFEGTYVFSGPSSVGKLMTARHLAKYLLCTGLVDDTCRCENCRLFPQVPDYFEINKGDENILVSDLDDFVEFLSLVPYRSRFRVAVIDNAHNISIETSNRLLKTLEDLKSNCLVILVTNRPDLLAKTVLSRCYEVEFGSLQTEDILSILKAKGHDAGKLAHIEKMIPYLTGNVLVDFVRYTDYVKYVPQFMKNILTIKEDDLVSLIKEIDEKHELLFFIEILVIFLNDILKIRYDSPDVVFNVKDVEAVDKIAVLWKEDLCVLTLDKLRTVHTIMAKNINMEHSQLVLPVFLWLYYFIQKEKSACANK